MIVMILPIIFLHFFSTKLIPEGGKAYIKCTFLVKIFETSAENDFFKLTDTRVWSTDLYCCVYFKDFVKQNI